MISAGTCITEREWRVRRSDSARLKVQMATVTNIRLYPAWKGRSTARFPFCQTGNLAAREDRFYVCCSQEAKYGVPKTCSLDIATTRAIQHGTLMGTESLLT